MIADLEVFHRYTTFLLKFFRLGFIEVMIKYLETYDHLENFINIGLW